MDTREALAQLVALKDHKDKFGKDAQYEAAKDKAWDDAREALKQPPMSEDEAVGIMANAMYEDSKRHDSGWKTMARQAYRALLARWGK